MTRLLIYNTLLVTYIATRCKKVSMSFATFYNVLYKMWGDWFIIIIMFISGGSP